MKYVLIVLSILGITAARADTRRAGLLALSREHRSAHTLRVVHLLRDFAGNHFADVSANTGDCDHRFCAQTNASVIGQTAREEIDLG